MIQCSKLYSDIPFSHRQPFHDGHCAFIHGHNWAFELTFGAEVTDNNGFVIDFGKLGFIKDWIKRNLDHACVFSKLDEVAPKLLNDYGNLFQPYFIEDGSCEGLAKHLYDTFAPMITEETRGRVLLLKVKVFEDSKNSAEYSAVL